MPSPPDADRSSKLRDQGAPLRAAKQTLRSQILAARDAIDLNARAEASLVIGQRIAAMPTFAASRIVLLTLPFRSEWDTRPLAREALATGKAVAAPRVNERARVLELRQIRDLDTDIVPGFRGIPEPRVTCGLMPEARIDFVVVPGVAFDPFGGRLGYGGGFYDRLLPLFAHGVPLVAGAFEVQVVAQVPSGPHDARVDCVATEKRLFGPAA